MNEPRFPYQPPDVSGGGLTVGNVVPAPGQKRVSTTDWLWEREVWKARAERAEKALRALYEAEGHIADGPNRCRFTGCTCGAVERRTDARIAAAKALRLAPRPATRESDGR